MKRRTKVHSRPIHVNIPISLLNDFDHELGFKEPRSKLICSLMQNHIYGGGTFVKDASSRRLMAALTAREDIDETLKSLILQILAKTP
jgi:hypothetical protein